MKRESSVQYPALSFRADVGTIDEEERTVEVVFSTGAPVERRDFWTGERFLESLSLDAGHVRLERLNSGNAPVLDRHHSFTIRDQFGHVVKDSVRITRKEARATLRFSKREDVDPLWGDIRDGIIRNVSVGYKTHAIEERKGKDGALTTRRAIDWEPFEVSLVPIGADAGAQTRQSDRSEEMTTCRVFQEATQEELPMAKKNGQDNAADDTRNEPNGPEGSKPNESAATPPPSPPDTNTRNQEGDRENREAILKAERVRVAEITRVCRAAGITDGARIEKFQKEGTSIEDVRRIVLEELATRSEGDNSIDSHRGLESGEDERDKYVRGISAWLLVRSGAASHVLKAKAKNPEHPAFRDVSTDPGQFRGMTLMDLARRCVERSGRSTDGMDRREIVALAIRGIGPHNTTSDFTVALENTLHKQLLGQFFIAPDTWRMFCGVGSVTDFRAHPRYRTGFIGSLDTVGESGEFKNKDIPDAVKESITAGTKGNILALSRQAIINDDMGVFTRIAGQLGRAAALSIETDVYALLALNAGLGPAMGDGNTLFHATHSNITTGAAISVAALDTDRQAMASQLDPAGNEFLDIRPAVLVVPLSLGGTARVLNEAEFDIDSLNPGTDESNKFMMPNRVRGLFRSVVDTPRQTGTRRYLFADPDEMPTLEVAFLDGQSEPFMEMQDGFRVDGVEWKVRYDYGVAAIEWRSAITNAGA